MEVIMLTMKRLGILVFFTLFLSACKGTINVTTYLEQADFPAGSGVVIYVAGERVGVTDAEGKLSIEVDAGEQTIRALLPGLVADEKIITVEENTIHQLDMYMVSGKLPEPVDVSVPSIINGVLAADFTEFVIQLTRDSGKPTSLIYFDYLRVANHKNLDNWVYITSLFELTEEGVLTAIDIESLNSVLAGLGFGELRFSFYAEDEFAGVYSEQVDFYLGLHSVYGQLASPPSNTSLSVGELTVQAKYLAGDIVMKQVADTAGAFIFEHLPAGNWEFTITTTSGDIIYTSFASIIMNRNKQLTLNLLTTEDLLNDVPYYEVVNTITTSALPELNLANSVVVKKRQDLDKELGAKREALSSVYVTSSDSVSISVIGGAVDTAQKKLQSLSVPAGTESITLTYTVDTAEYPAYVLDQSMFNDVWLLMVNSENGASLFSKSRQVNSQLYSEPVWQSNGSTGEIVETIDVSALTATDINITLYGSSTNIGDSYLPTYVNATLSFEPKFNIKSVTHTGTDYFSIPRHNETNIYSKTYRLELNKPTDATITKVTAKLLQNSNGNELMTVVDEAPGIKAVLIDDDTIDVTVTMNQNYTSSVHSQPPTQHMIRYSFRVESELNGTMLDDVKDSAPIKALWLIPDSISRFGFRDNGKDGWAAKGTYEWLLSNAESIPEVNDISGEHSRNIDHSTHRRGTDIDIYHFTDLTGGVRRGGLNYQLIHSKTASALLGNIADRATVTDWILSARSGLDTLTGQNTVAEVISGSGASSLELPSGWLRSLMETGLLASGTDILNLDIGTWNNTGVRYRNDHNDHFHIDLNDTNLNNQP